MNDDALPPLDSQWRKGTTGPRVLIAEHADRNGVPMARYVLLSTELKDEWWSGDTVAAMKLHGWELVFAR